MPFWQRLIITLVAMIAASFIGGLTALPVWEFLKRIGPKPYRQVAS